MRILIVEDDMVSRSVLSRFLCPFGQVDTAEDGDQGYQMFAQSLDQGQPYDLITLDIMMPRKDGHATLLAIRDLEHRRGIGPGLRSRVIVTTALDDVHNITASFRELCDEYVVKPIRKPTLYDKIGELGFPLPG